VTRSRSPFSGDVLLRIVRGYMSAGQPLPVALASALVEIDAAVAISDLTPEELKALAVPLTYLRYAAQASPEAALCGKEDLRRALRRDPQGLAMFKGPAGETVALEPLGTPPAPEPPAPGVREPSDEFANVANSDSPEQPAIASDAPPEPPPAAPPPKQPSGLKPAWLSRHRSSPRRSRRVIANRLRHRAPPRQRRRRTQSSRAASWWARC
jgi:hypothetical protein